MPDAFGRRDLLKRSSALAAVPVIGSLAGCADVSPFGDDRSTLVGEMRRWGPLPEKVLADVRSYLTQYRLSGLNLVTARSVPENVRQLLSLDAARRRYEPLGIRKSDLQARISIGSGISVLRAEYDGDDVAENLEAAGFERLDDHEEFRLYRGELSVARTARENNREPVLLGINGSYVVDVQSTSRPESGNLAVVDSLVNAYDGDRPRYAEESDVVDTILSEVDADLGVGAREVPEVSEEAAQSTDTRLAGAVGYGTGIEVTDGSFRHDDIFVFESADDVDEGALNRYYEASWAGFDLREIEVDGRVATLVLEASVDDITTRQPV